jgi:hypothetical protein
VLAIASTSQVNALKVWKRDFRRKYPEMPENVETLPKK